MQVKRVLLIENFSSDFYKARAPLANFLMEKGWDVYALIPNDDYLPLIQATGVKVIGYELNRKNKGLWQIFRLIGIYRKVIKTYGFTIVHSFRFQPNLINALANLFSRRKVFLHVTGLGVAFSNNSFRYRIYRFMSQMVFQLKLLSASKVIVQNPDDAKDIWLSSFWKKKIALIKGSGVNTSVFDAALYDKLNIRERMDVSKDGLIFICVTRLLWEKGIQEMTDAFLSFPDTNAKLWVIGWSDKDNPRHIPDEFIANFAGHPKISFLGRREDVKELLAASDVFLYPSYYREGIPRGILEALSISLPVITTDMPGCNLTVKDGVNGFMLHNVSSEDIQHCIKKTIDNRDRLKEMGQKSRELALAEFDEKIIFAQIENLYR